MKSVSRLLAHVSSVICPCDTYVVYYPHMSIGKVWIYRLLFVCVFLWVCL